MPDKKKLQRVAPLTLGCSGPTWNSGLYFGSEDVQERGFLEFTSWEKLLGGVQKEGAQSEGCPSGRLQSGSMATRRQEDAHRQLTQRADFGQPE